MGENHQDDEHPYSRIGGGVLYDNLQHGRRRAAVQFPRGAFAVDDYHDMIPYAELPSSDEDPAMGRDGYATSTLRSSAPSEPDSIDTSLYTSLYAYDDVQNYNVGVRRARDRYEHCSPQDQARQWRLLKEKEFPRLMPTRPDLLVPYLQVKDEWVQSEALTRLLCLALNLDSNTKVTSLQSTEVEVWSLLSQKASHPLGCHVIALHALLWTRLWSQEGRPGDERHVRRWQEISAYQGMKDNSCEDDALSDLLRFLDVKSSHEVGELRWTLLALYVKLRELAKGQASKTAGAEAVDLIRSHPQKTDAGFFLLHLVLVNALNCLLLSADSVGVATFPGRLLSDWNGSDLEPLAHYLKDALNREDIRLPPHQRGALLEMLRPHVFHRNVTVRYCLAQLLQEPQLRDRLPPAVEVSKVEREMAAFRLKINKPGMAPGFGKDCQWREMGGHADEEGGRVAVQVHFYSHTLACLRREGSSRCEKVGPLVLALDIRHSLESQPFLGQVLQHGEHGDLAKYYVHAAFSPDQRLVHLVIEQRQYSVQAVMKHFVAWGAEAAEALDYLHKKGIVLVDLSASSLVFDNATVKVVDFNSAMRWKTSQEVSVEAMPLRWLAPESLLEGRFHPPGDVLALGRLLYQLCTGGLQPYGELYTADTRVVLEAVAACSPLHPWHCIPEDIMNIIRSCTAPEADRRPRLSVVRDLLRGFQTTAGKAVGRGSVGHWPELDVHQIALEHVPEKASAEQIDRLRQLHNTGYQNLGLYKKPLEKEPCSWDVPTVIKEVNGTVVYEPLTEGFVDRCWPMLRELELGALGQLSECPQPKVFPSPQPAQPSRARQRRQYPASDTLQEKAEAVKMASLLPGDGPVLKPELEMLLLLLQLAEALEVLHGEGWIYRDLSTHTVLVTRRPPNQIILHRLGRMRLFRKHENQETRALYMNLEKNASHNHRFPPETNTDKEYGPASEVYVFAVTAWEVLETLRPRQTSDSGSTREKPVLCDERIFQLLQSCWREREHRPSMDHVVTELRAILHSLDLTLPARTCRPPSCSPYSYVEFPPYAGARPQGKGQAGPSGSQAGDRSTISSTSTASTAPYVTISEFLPNSQASRQGQSEPLQPAGRPGGKGGAGSSWSLSAGVPQHVSPTDFQHVSSLYSVSQNHVKHRSRLDVRNASPVPGEDQRGRSPRGGGPPGEWNGDRSTRSSSPASDQDSLAESDRWRCLPPERPPAPPPGVPPRLVTPNPGLESGGGDQQAKSRGWRPGRRGGMRDRSSPQPPDKDVLTQRL